MQSCEGCETPECPYACHFKGGRPTGVVGKACEFFKRALKGGDDGDK